MYDSGSHFIQIHDFSAVESAISNDALFLAGISCTPFGFFNFPQAPDQLFPDFFRVVP